MFAQNQTAATNFTWSSKTEAGLGRSMMIDNDNQMSSPRILEAYRSVKYLVVITPSNALYNETKFSIHNHFSKAIQWISSTIFFPNSNTHEKQLKASLKHYLMRNTIPNEAFMFKWRQRRSSLPYIFVQDLYFLHSIKNSLNSTIAIVCGSFISQADINDGLKWS